MKKYIIPMFAALALVACNKDDDKKEDDPTPPAEPSAQTPAPDGVEAVFVALNVSATVELPGFGSTTIFQGVPLVRIFDNSSAGTITCEDKELNNSGNGSYTYTMSATDTEGISYSGSVDWEATGGGTIGAFTYTHNATVPEIADLSGDEDGEVDLSSDFTLSYNASQSSLGSADSLYFCMYDAGGEVLIKKTAANTSSATFTAGEMSQLAAGFGYVQVNAFTYVTRNEGGADIAFIAQGTSTKSVDLK